jgi:oligopeptide/dipeptide ABC transporter ATP-binding protein
VVAEVAHRVVVMYCGRVVEEAALRRLFTDPMHPYTWGLLGSVPRVDHERPLRLPTISGALPSLLAPPTGCHFHPRCPHRFEPCDPEIPGLEQRAGAGHADRCHLPVEDKRRLRIVGGAIGLPVVSPAGAGDSA